jgi:glycyl-tRNA synthetase beta chain
LSLEFILEVGCEEIPARFVEGALAQLKQRFSESLSRNSIEHEAIQTYATPRRLVVISQLAARQPDRSEVVAGPPYAVAFDKDRQPTGAALGFARKYQLTVDQLRPVETGKGQYLGFEKRIAGLASDAILGAELPSILASLEFPKSMRWERSQFSFIRPIRWILCLLGGRVVPFVVAGVAASNRSFGHRILSANVSSEVNATDEYRRFLLDNYVVLDPRERLKRIEDCLKQEALNNNFNLLENKTLLDTVIYLNEHPVIVCGGFDPEFLGLPQEVLITVMREHQKYFSLLDEQGRLVPKFLAVVDSDGSHCDKIRAGHERVLKARLADAGFFWELDQKVLLEDRVDKLGRIIFQTKLGTLLEKTNRLISLVDFLARSVKRAEIGAELKEAAKLCKTDLTTEMVREFTDLQGIMGGLYARVQGLPEFVASAIYEHYRPTTLEDQSPQSAGGALLSIADKLDSVVGAFSIGVVPTGSKDPLALRRQAMGIIKVILDHSLSISFRKLFLKSFSLYRKKATRSVEESLPDFEDFIKERLRHIFKEEGFRYDEVNSVVDISYDNPLDCLNKIRAIAAMRGSADFASVSQSFKRIKNIIIKAGMDIRIDGSVDPALFECDEERELKEVIQRIEPQVRRASRRGHYQQAFERMASLRPQIDQFFDKVLVMAEDPTVRQNRLLLLRGLLQVFLELADVSEITPAPL